MQVIAADVVGVQKRRAYNAADEERYITIGHSQQGRILMVAHTDKGKRIRLISARELTKTEREVYEEEK